MSAACAILLWSVASEGTARTTGSAALGYCDTIARRIVVASDQPANARVRTLIHELAHALGVGYADYGRQAAEVVVESAATIACASAGLDAVPSTIRLGAAIRCFHYGEVRGSTGLLATSSMLPDTVGRQLLSPGSMSPLGIGSCMSFLA
jgi:hypothetical protein